MHRRQPLSIPQLLYVPILLAARLHAAEAPPDYRFKAETLATGMAQPMELELAPDGRIFFNEINGRLRIWKPGAGIVEAGRIPVFNAMENMVRWVFALEPGKTGAGLARGLRGQIKAPKDDALRTALLEATYTDNGRAPAGSLVGRSTVKLRHRRLEAERADTITGARVLGKFVGAIDHGHALRFASLNLNDSSSATVRVASAGAGGTIEIRAGSATGDLLAGFEVAPTGAWDKWVELTAPLKPAARGDVFVVFVNPGKGGLMNLDWIEFNTK